MGSDFTTQVKRQFQKRADKPSVGLKDVKFYRFPSVLENANGRELVWTVKAMPWGNANRNITTSEIVNSYNATCAWVDAAGTKTRIKPEPLTDAEVKEFLAITKSVTDQRSREKDADRLRNAPRAIILTAPDGSAQIAKGEK